MNYIKEHTCCIFGHRKIQISDGLKNKLRQTIEHLITEMGVNTFLFGSKSEFDKLCYETVSELRGAYPFLRRIYVRAEFPDIDEEYNSYLLSLYEETYYPEKIMGAHRAVYAERNQHMIDGSMYCIVYYSEEYSPQNTRETGKYEIVRKKKSGTRLAYDYAKKHGRVIFNCADI